MRLTDCRFEYLNDADILGSVDRGQLISNGDPDGQAKITLFYWDDGREIHDMDGKKVPVQERAARMRMYDNLVEAKIEEIDDGSWRITGLSNRAEQHGAFGPTDNRITIKVVEGPNCRGCSGR
jgi:hypothetical protein